VVVAAYDDYLRARGLLDASGTSYEQLQEAVRLLKAALAADPAFVDGWALLCRARATRWRGSGSSNDRQAEAAAVAQEARAALERARALAPESAATLKAAGFLQQTVEQDPVNALRSLDRAVAAAPNDAETLFFQASLLFSLGRSTQPSRPWSGLTRSTTRTASSPSASP